MKNLFDFSCERKKRRRNEALVCEIDPSTDSIPIRVNEEILGIDFFRETEKGWIVIVGAYIGFHVLSWIDHTPGMRKITSTDFRIFLSIHRRRRFDGCRTTRSRLHYFCVGVRRCRGTFGACFWLPSHFHSVDIGQGNGNGSCGGLNTFVLNQKWRTKTRISKEKFLVKRSSQVNAWSNACPAEHKSSVAMLLAIDQIRCERSMASEAKEVLCIESVNAKLQDNGKERQTSE